MPTRDLDLAALALYRRLIGPDHHEFFPHESLAELARAVRDDRRLASTLHAAYVDPLCREPWTIAELEDLIAIGVSPPTPPAPEGLTRRADAPSRLTLDATDYLFSLRPFRSEWLRYALSTSILSDSQFTYVLRIVRAYELSTTNYPAEIAGYVRIHITSFARLLQSLNVSQVNPIAAGTWSDLLLILPHTQDDLLTLLPHLNDHGAAHLLLTTTSPRPSLATIAAYAQAHPQFADVITSQFTAHYTYSSSIDARSLLRLLLYLPGVDPLFMSSDTRSVASNPSLVAVKRALTRLISSCDYPEALSRLLANPSCSLSQALSAAQALAQSDPVSHAAHLALVPA